MSKKRFAGVLVALLCFLVTGCQSQTLSKKKSMFEGDAGEVTFHLPAGWKETKKPEEYFLPEAVFGAEDTKTQSAMFVRTYEEDFSNEKQLEKFTETHLSKYYEMGEQKPEAFKTGKVSTIHYRLKTLYKEKEMWLELYFTAADKQVIEYQFFNPINRTDDKRAELFQESVATAKWQNVAYSSTSKEEITAGLGKNDELELKVTTYKTLDLSDDSSVLVIRYLCTNNGTKAFVPAEKWQQLVTVKQGETLLEELILPENEPEHSELHFLLETSEQPLKSENRIEGVALYQLPEKKAVSLSYDSAVFPTTEVVQLSIE